jgi:Ca-activated chloride channel family protein
VGFPSRSIDDKDFVENLWARRKVGFLLDQIRLNGEQKELMDEMMTLAKKYGIATPYTSYLVVPDAPMPVVGLPPGQGPMSRPVATSPSVGGPVPPALYEPGFGGIRGGGSGGGLGKPAPVSDFAKRVQTKPDDGKKNRYFYEDKKLADDEAELSKTDPKDPNKGDKDQYLGKVKEARGNFRSYQQAREWLAKRDLKNIQAGNSTAVDVAVCSNNLRCQDRLTQTAMRNVSGRNCLEIGGVWIDEGYSADMKTLVIKAQSDAYFKIIEKNPKMKDVFRLGNYLVFVTPSKVALIVDTVEGKEKLTDDEIAKLFVAAK